MQKLLEYSRKDLRPRDQKEYDTVIVKCDTMVCTDVKGEFRKN